MWIFDMMRQYLSRMLWWTVWVFIGLGTGMGCGNKDRAAPLVGPAVLQDVRIVSGNNQSGNPGEPLLRPLVVEAVDTQGRSVGGVTVRFSVTSGGGALTDTSGVTGVTGRAQTQLTLGAVPGLNKVSILVSGLSGLPPTFTATGLGEEAPGDSLAPPPALVRPPDSTHFSVAPEVLNMPGGVVFGLTNSITAFVFDEASNPVRAGTVVRFKTSGGGIEGAVRTNAEGRATAVLTTAEPLPEDGWATVTAETDGAGGTVLTAQSRVLFSGPTVVRLIQPASFAVVPGESQAFLFFVGDANGHPLSAGTLIQVSAEGGSLTGQTEVTLPDTQSPDATRFSVLFEAQQAGDTPSMTIETTSPNGNRKAIFVSGLRGIDQGDNTRFPAVLSVDAADSVLVADGASTTTITASVQDSAGNGVANETVSFSTSGGTVDATALTDASGLATVIYRSPVNPLGVPVVRVEARTRNLVAADTLRLLGVRLSLSVQPDTLAADGISQATITAKLETEAGSPVPFVSVDFGATLGVLSEARVQTDVTGQASVVYTSVASPSDLAGVEVRARASGLDASKEIRLLGVQVLLSVSPDTIAADGNAQATIRVALHRTDGVVIPNGIVAFETSLGTLSSPLVETDNEGVAQSILVAGTDAGKATISATYGVGLRKLGAVAFVKGPPTSIVLVSVEPPSIGVRSAGANEPAIVTFEVRDDRGNTVADGQPVLFQLDAPDSVLTPGLPGVPPAFVAVEGEELIGPERTAA